MNSASNAEIMRLLTIVTVTGVCILVFLFVLTVSGRKLKTAYRSATVTGCRCDLVFWHRVLCPDVFLLCSRPIPLTSMTVPPIIMLISRTRLTKIIIDSGALATNSVSIVLITVSGIANTTMNGRSSDLNREVTIRQIRKTVSDSVKTSECIEVLSLLSRLLTVILIFVLSGWVVSTCLILMTVVFRLLRWRPVDISVMCLRLMWRTLSGFMAVVILVMDDSWTGRVDFGPTMRPWTLLTEVWLGLSVCMRMLTPWLWKSQWAVILLCIPCIIRLVTRCAARLSVVVCLRLKWTRTLGQLCLMADPTLVKWLEALRCCPTLPLVCLSVLRLKLWTLTLSGAVKSKSRGCVNPILILGCLEIAL